MEKAAPLQTEREARLIAQLRDQPELLERFEHILALTQSEGTVRKVDEIEDLLVEEVRKLGNATMEQWAKKAEEQVALSHGEKHPKTHVAKKKS